MSTDDRIAILQALLARVKSRSGEHAHTNGTPLHHDDEVLGTMPSNPLDVPTPMAAFRPSPLPPAPSPPLAPPPAPPSSSTLSPPERVSQPPSGSKFSLRPEAPPLSFSVRPPASADLSEPSLDRTFIEAVTPPRRIAPPAEPSGVRALQPPPMEVVELELDLDPDPSIPPPPVAPPSVAPPASARKGDDAFESRSRLVSALPAAFETSDLADLDEGEEPFELARAASDPTIEAARAEVTQEELDAIEEADRAPSSSRRPISIEEKMSEQEDLVPLHTPPPESGRIPSALPVIELQLDPEPASAPMPIAAHASPAEAPALARQALRAERPPAQAEVALFVGRAPNDDPPKTFGDLLEESLSP